MTTWVQYIPKILWCCLVKFDKLIPLFIRPTFYLIGFVIIALRQKRFPYIVGHVTIIKDVQVDFSQISSIPLPKYFDAVL